MKFREVYYGQNSADVLLIQPNVLQKIKPENIDPVQTYYWDTCSKVGSLFGDLPIEPNWGLLSIAKALSIKGYTSLYLYFHLYDYIKIKKENEFLTENDLVKILSKKKFSFVGISTMTISHYNALKIAEICKKVNPDCKVILGGLQFSFLPFEGVNNEYVDAVLRGEGEFSFVDLIYAMKNGLNLNNVSGVVYKNNEGKIIETTPKLINDLNVLPFPMYELWPEDIPLIPRIYTARGCNGGCDYCVVNQFFYGKYRKRNIEKVFEEIKYVVNNMNCTDLLIGDLNLGADKDNIIKLCNLIIENNLKIKWWCQTRAKDLDDEVLEIISKAGCVQIGIGIESADEEILNSTSSNKSNEKINIIDLCTLIHKHKMEVQGYFIIGLPGEDIDTAINTIKSIDFLTSEGYVDITHIAVLVPYPGTPIYDRTEAYDLKIISQDFSKYIMNCDYMNTGIPVVETKELSCYQIYSLWQLALSTAAKNFEKRTNKNTPSMFENLDEFWRSIKLK